MYVFSEEKSKFNMCNLVLMYIKQKCLLEKKRVLILCGMELQAWERLWEITHPNLCLQARFLDGPWHIKSSLFLKTSEEMSICVDNPFQYLKIIARTLLLIAALIPLCWSFKLFCYCSGFSKEQFVPRTFLLTSKV